MSIKNWSVVAASNNSAPPNGAPESTTTLADVNDIMRQMMADVRTLAASDTIASAGTCDIGAKDNTFLTVTGTTTITALGTVSAGIYKFLTFDDVLTFTHNATSLILPTSDDITTAAGDTALMLSKGAGNWKCMMFQRADGTTAAVTSGGYQPLDSTLTALAGVLTAANKIPYATATNVAGELTFSTSTSLGTSDTTISSQNAVKTYVDTQVATKAGTASPAFTGVPTAPTAAAGTNTSQIATTAFVTNAVAATPLFSAATDVKASRSSGTVYHNTNTKPMMVMASFSLDFSASDTATANIGATSSPTLGAGGVGASLGSGTGSMSMSFMVPPGYYYKITTSGTISTWVECV